jgi:hypothetical protein
MSSTSWYTTVNTISVEQGDFVQDVPIIVTEQLLTNIKQEVNPTIDTFDMVVLSQSCDLINLNKLSQVQLAPIYTLKALLKRNKGFNKLEWLNNLRKNNVNRYYLLGINRGSTFKLNGLLVIDFGNIRSIPVKTLFELCKKQPKRRRLASPYLEQMSQQLARFYMRVGLPNDIPEFTKPVKLD